MLLPASPTPPHALARETIRHKLLYAQFTTLRMYNFCILRTHHQPSIFPFQSFSHTSPTPLDTPTIRNGGRTNSCTTNAHTSRALPVPNSLTVHPRRRSCTATVRRTHSRPAVSFKPQPTFLPRCYLTFPPCLLQFVL